MKTLGLVTARAGSKGLRNKHLLDLGGLPVIAWTISAALKATGLDRVVLSTDSPEIAEVGRQVGAEVPFLRPRVLARDHSPHIDVVLHALDWLQEHQKYNAEYCMLLQPTSPFRDATDIEGAVALAAAREAPGVLSVSATNVHPFFVFRFGEADQLVPYVQRPSGYLRRQALPEAWHEDGAMYLRRVVELRVQRTFLESGTLGYRLPTGHGMQIDTERDLEEARTWLDRRR